VGPGPLSFRQFRLTAPAYFQGAGAGSGPFFQGAGAGSGPFFQGAGAGSGPFFITGTGAEPFAIMNEPSPCAVTIVFRPIAPAKTSIGRSRTTDLRDILVPPRDGNYPGGTLYEDTLMSSSSRLSGPVANWYTARSKCFRWTFARRAMGLAVTTVRVRSRTYRVNGTGVLRNLGLCRDPSEATGPAEHATHRQ